jgi:hypothetical protein
MADINEPTIQFADGPKIPISAFGIRFDEAKGRVTFWDGTSEQMPEMFPQLRFGDSFLLVKEPEESPEDQKLRQELYEQIEEAVLGPQPIIVGE